MGEKSLNRRSSKNSSIKKFLVPFVIFFILAAAAFGAYYFTFYKNNSNYINSLHNEKLKIDKANSQVADAFKNFDQIDTKNTEEISKVTKILSNSEAIIQDVLTRVKGISPISKYKTQHDNYLRGIEENKKIFAQTLLILQNPTHKDVDKAVEALYKYVSDSTRLYEQAKLGKAYITLPSELLALPDKISQFVAVEKTDYEAKSRILEQYSKYFTEMDKVINGFKGTKTDLSSYIDQINSNKTTLENVYLNIEKKLMALKDLKASFDKISIPPKSIKNHEQFDNVIKGYMDYCEEFKSNLIQFEEAGTDNDKLTGVNQIFQELKKQYKNLDSSFTDYINKYNQDKQLYGDISNI